MLGFSSFFIFGANFRRFHQFSPLLRVKSLDFLIGRKAQHSSLAKKGMKKAPVLIKTEAF
jgi:hypothetical protein